MFLTTRLTISSTGAATFSSSVTAGGKIFTSASVADNIIEVINSDTTNGYGLYVRAGGTATNRYVARFKNGADSDVMWVGNNGNVGIGIAAPLARLHIVAPTNDIALRFQQQNDSTSQYYFNVDSAVNGALSLVTNYLGGTAVGFSQSRAANVSIGTSTDSGYKLDVNGTGRFSDNLTINGTNKNVQLGSNALPTTSSNLRHYFAGAATFVGQDGAGEGKCG